MAAVVSMAVQVGLEAAPSGAAVSAAEEVPSVAAVQDEASKSGAKKIIITENIDVGAFKRQGLRRLF